MSSGKTRFADLGVAGRATPYNGPRATRTRELLLGAARDLFFEQGYAGTSMEDVAARAGVSRASVYTYFPSKFALFAELGVSTYRAIDAIIDQLATVPTNPADSDLEPWVELFLRTLDEHKAFVVQWNEAALDDEAARKAWRTNELKLTTRLGEQLGALAGWDKADSAKVGLGIFGMVSHLWIVWRVADAPFTETDVVRSLAASIGGLLRGFGGGD